MACKQLNLETIIIADMPPNAAASSLFLVPSSSERENTSDVFVTNCLGIANSVRQRSGRRAGRTRAHRNFNVISKASIKVCIRARRVRYFTISLEPMEPNNGKMSSSPGFIRSEKDYANSNLTSYIVKHSLSFSAVEQLETQPKTESNVCWRK